MLEDPRELYHPDITLKKPSVISRNDYENRQDLKGILKKFNTAQLNSVSQSQRNNGDYHKPYMNPQTNASGTTTPS